MALVQITFGPTRDAPRGAEFQSWANHVRNLYFRKLPKFDTGIVRKIMIFVHEGASETYETTGKSDITSNTWHFDFDGFWKANESTRKRMVLERIRDSLLEVAKVQKWNPQPIRDAYDAVLAANFANEAFGEKEFKSPDGRWIARWHYSYGPDKIAFSIALKSKDGDESRQIPLFKTKPIDSYLNGVLGKLKWLSNTKVALLAKDGDQQGVADLEASTKKSKRT